MQAWRRVQIARLGGSVRGKNRFSLSKAGRRGGKTLSLKYGSDYFSRLGMNDGKVGGVASGVGRRSKK